MTKETVCSKPDEEEPVVPGGMAETAIKDCHGVLVESSHTGVTVFDYTQKPITPDPTSPDKPTPPPS